MKYRKKPVVIEAVQLLPQTIKQVYEFIHGHPPLKKNPSAMDEEKWWEYELLVKEEGMRLKTLESHNETQIASIGDYVIKGVKGEFYPCKPDIFEETYESVEETEATHE